MSRTNFHQVVDKYPLQRDRVFQLLINAVGSSPEALVCALGIVCQRDWAVRNVMRHASFELGKTLSDRLDVLSPHVRQIYRTAKSKIKENWRLWPTSFAWWPSGVRRLLIGTSLIDFGYSFSVITPRGFWLQCFRIQSRRIIQITARNMLHTRTQTKSSMCRFCAESDSQNQGNESRDG